MQGSYCPYCHSVKSMLLGDVYCSRQHERSMDDMSTGTLFIKSKRLEETGDHISRLSIRCTLNGEQHYKVGSNDFLITPQNFLVVNQGQHYKTSFDSDSEQEMILVAFQPGFAEDLHYSLVNTTLTLLDEPFRTHSNKLFFFEKTYDRDPIIHLLFQHLRRLMELDDKIKKELDLQSIYTALLTRLLEIQRDIRFDIDRLTGTKQSTRTELYRRLNIAKGYMEANLSKQISLEDISKTACLSVHHFKREFKLLFGYSPHQYLVLKRMQKAELLLMNKSLTINEIAVASGFENTSSFIRQFHKMKGHTPGKYRNAYRC